MEWNCGIPHYGFSAQMHIQGFQALRSELHNRGEAAHQAAMGNVVGTFLRLLAVGRRNTMSGKNLALPYDCV
jgi:hypothetical protein